MASTPEIRITGKSPEAILFRTGVKCS